MMEISELEKARPPKVREPRYASDRQRFFKERGWIMIEDILTPDEVREARAELERIESGELEVTYKPGKSAVAYQSTGKYSKVADKTLDPSRYSEVFRKITRSPVVADIVKEVTGLQSIRLFGDQVIRKSPEAEGGIGSGVHQDLPFYPLDRAGGCVMWVALDDLPDTAGTLRFIEGSHKWGPVGRRQNVAGWLADHPEDEALTTEPFALKAGSCTIHDILTLHGTSPNRWDRPRVGYMMSFIPADTRFTGMPSRWTDGLGLEIDGFLDHEYFPVVG
ncbi:phytanoyl-CoA dioxygenase family protein [Sphingopyxis macrogoltabida]|uniref:Phytanoyl-CoA dioxygenase n=1 Tax=Sphingopyxis macrogoltabida TaxID=33050 RepID=A0AAC9FHH0_SPHMC|nr:phytanoyl-CoA dioxygenase family protein [Sphingopyxis macrogoltabida]ALJ16324.1 hypothetical protein LH19_26340 [Sphingopyxis macrogoltabida]AMU92561.1 hypothetical protein ATM17_30340 [Sphingopyxis macrogoltabida]